eukprot:TRINITY_DN3499_c0_g1_i4.p1 TRINITY_DN3499_c0_g1~~TRINITY_DN3499_c0_g1_i4.p1  ORF type:complete len:103 (+),score=1.52 TRINITY_DN3499_c0_g1_i4:127-435(+)
MDAAKKVLLNVVQANRIGIPRKIIVFTQAGRAMDALQLAMMLPQQSPVKEHRQGNNDNDEKNHSSQATSTLSYMLPYSGSDNLIDAFSYDSEVIIGSMAKRC